MNSLAGLAGTLVSVRALPAALPLWVVAAGADGALGAELGNRRMGSVALQRLLAVVLVVVALKLLLT